MTPCFTLLYSPLPGGSASTTRTSSDMVLRNCPVPAIVPPVPAPAMNASKRPLVCLVSRCDLSNHRRGQDWKILASISRGPCRQNAHQSSSGSVQVGEQALRSRRNADTHLELVCEEATRLVTHVGVSADARGIERLVGCRRDEHGLRARRNHVRLVVGGGCSAVFEGILFRKVLRGRSRPTLEDGVKKRTTNWTKNVRLGCFMLDV